VEWNSAWLTEPDLHHAYNGTQALKTYNKQTTAPQRKKTRKTTPTPPHKLGGWQPQNTTYTTQPFIPDLDAEATIDTYEIAHHPIIPTEVLIHSPTGRLITTMTTSRLQKLRNLYRPNNENTPLPKAIAELILRHKDKAYDTIPSIKSHPLNKQKT
jgi:hypothetical protein